MRVREIAGTTILILAAWAAPAYAHHSFSMYDNSKDIPMTGLVKEFQWQNPHVNVVFHATMPDGHAEDWVIECSAVNILGRRGWKYDSLKAGDRIHLTMHPMRDGRKIGLMIAATTPAGFELKDKQ